MCRGGGRYPTGMPEYEYVLSRSDGPVGIVTLNRPKQLNALAGPLMQELVDALEGHAADPLIRAIVVTGGPTVFAAGADIKEMADSSAVDMLLRSRIGLWDRIRQVSKPLIAAVAGYALGGGCELAMACTLRIAADTAKLGQPEIALGLIPGYAGTQRLPRLVGRGKAMEMILTGAPIAAGEAQRIGLVNRVVPAAELMTEARALAAQLAKSAPIAMRYIISAVNKGVEMPFAEACQYEATLFGLVASTEDMREGTSAFLEKRKAEFKGR
jgi:enoyl-CoA hydratase/carnithine racemase